MHCPAGTFITRIFGWSGQGIDAISVKCSNGDILGPYGGSGGNTVEGKTCKSGITSVLVYYSTTSVSGFLPYCVGHTNMTMLGTSYSHQFIETFKCPNNYHLTKIIGSYSNVVSSLMFTCEELGTFMLL
jgi:hypothetical protein